MRRIGTLAFVVAVATGCGRGQWPSPPPVDPITYQREHEAWLARERANLSKVLPVTGIWPLGDGETAFGADPALPIPLPAAHVAPRAGAFRRVGGTVTVTPAADFVLRREDGSRLDGETRVHRVLAGPFRLDVTDVGDDRRWVTATDTTHQAITAPPPLPSYPLDGQWRVAARFDRFDAPKRLRVPDVQGGSMEVTALGQLVFRLKGQEFRLTAIGQRLAVWFKDPTNGSTTYRGYRVVRPQVGAAVRPGAILEGGEWTVLDFNFSSNPPCAYSTFTTCPLPPSENRLPVAIEAGLKKLPSVDGY
jgi:uncharacterized protein